MLWRRECSMMQTVRRRCSRVESCGARGAFGSRWAEAWFSILRALPELEPVLGVGHVEVMGTGLRLRVADEGLATLSSADHTRVVRAFRPTA